MDQLISQALAEYDKSVMENFQNCTEAVNKVLAEHDTKMRQKIEEIEKELMNNRELCKEKAQELSVKRNSVKSTVKTTVNTPSRNLRRFGHPSATTSIEPNKTTVNTPSRNLRRFGHQSPTTSVESKNKQKKKV
jgi:hypothetical protein